MSPLKAPALLTLALLLLLTSACRAADVCPAGSVTYEADSSLFPALALPIAIDPTPSPTLVEIAGKMMAVDHVVTGSVCNDVWSGTIYVACNIHIIEWNHEDEPTFFKNCDLKIEQGTVVYVAAHNDAAYYNGCSCHTGEEHK